MIAPIGMGSSAPFGLMPARLRVDEESASKGDQSTEASQRADSEKTQSERPGNRSSQGELSEQEKKEVTELKKADREIKQHEMAHMAAASGLSVSGAQFEYKRGPDGVMYAVAGEVNIDTSPVSGDPKATLDKARKIERAALAPVDPSPQDRKVAAQARQMASEARLAMMRQPTSPSPQQGATIDIEA